MLIVTRKPRKCQDEVDFYNVLYTDSKEYDHQQEVS